MPAGFQFGVRDRENFSQQALKRLSAERRSHSGSILADDVTAVAGIGAEDDKASILADVRSHDLTYKKLIYDHRKIRIYSDTAVVTSHAAVVANYKERDITGKIFGTRVYRYSSFPVLTAA